MSDDLLEKINAALDSSEGLEGDLELQRLFAKDDAASEMADEMQRTDKALRGWPSSERSDDAWEALAARVDQRLDEELAPLPSDPTEPPDFDDAEAEGTTEGSGQFSLNNLQNLDMDDPSKGEMRPIGAPAPAAAAPSAPAKKKAPPKRDSGDRFSFSDLGRAPAPAQRKPDFLSIEPESKPQPAKKAQDEAAGTTVYWIGGAFAVAAAVGLVYFSGVLSSEPEEVSQLAVETAEVPGSPAADQEYAPAAADPAPAEVMAEEAEGEAMAELEPEAARTAAAGGAPQAALPERLEAPASMMSSRARRGLPTMRSLTMAERPPPSMETPTPMMTTAMAAPGTLPATPARDDVVRAMRAVAPAVTACGTGARHGVAEVQIVVGSSGRIRSALVTGYFAGTPEGSCVARAVRRARLPQFQEESFRFTYPFRL